MQTFFTETSLPIVQLSTISSLREFKWFFQFSTVRDTLPSSFLLITMKIITLRYGREFWIKVFRILSSTTREDSFTQLFVPTCKIIVSGHFYNKGRRYWWISAADAPGKRRTFTGYFFDNFCSSKPDIIESPVIKLVFHDHLWIWSLLLGVLTEDGFEGDKAVVSISILLKLRFFWNWDFTVYVLLMILLTNFFYLVIYVAFLFLDGTSIFCIHSVKFRNFT